MLRHVLFDIPERRLVTVPPRGLLDNNVSHTPSLPLSVSRSSSQCTRAYTMRRHGPFEPHRLSLDDMEYTTMPQIMERLAGRWQPIPEPGQLARELVGAGRGHARGDGRTLDVD